MPSCGARSDDAHRQCEPNAHRTHAARRVDVVRVLLNRKANINKPAADGATPLIVAAQHHQLDVVELLLKRKADVRVLDKTQGWALWSVVRRRVACCFTCVMRLFARVARRVLTTRWPARWAAHEGQLAICKALIEARSPLHLVLPAETVRVGRARPTPAPQVNENGETCLYVAAARGHGDVVRLV